MSGTGPSASERRRDDALLRMLKHDSKVSVTDATGHFIEVNDNFCQLSGYSREELLGQPHSMVTSGIHSREFWGDMWRTVGAGRPWRDEICNRAKDGALYWVDSTISPINGADGSPLEYIMIFRDITARKRVEARLQEASDRFAIAADSGGIGIWDFDAGGKTLIWDDRMYRIYGLPAGSGQEPYATWVDRLHVDDRDRLLTEIGSALSGEKEYDTDFRIVRPDGEMRYLKATARTFRPTDGSAARMIGVNIDVTDHKRAELALLDMSSITTQRAEEANRAKSQFLANMSHEIRTPMNAVIGLSYLLAETPLDAAQLELLGKIQVSSKSLLAILNDVLDLTKIEAGELMVESTVFSPYSLLRGICDVIAIQAHAKGIDFDVEVGDDLPIAVQGDATRLGQILTNLLVNAVKFTDRGGVTLRVTQFDETPAGTTLRFVVRDTGIGISPAAQAHLFAPFSQADASITRRYGGTGLGLSIVKSLAELMGGSISLQSTPGIGSEFSVDLKFVPTAPELLAGRQNLAETPQGRAVADVRVLLVDDSDINLDVTKRVLELHGAQVQLASNGLEACDRVRMQPYDFDVVLMDVQMPLLDGYQATRYIRAELGLVDLPIIALTASALSSERQRAVAAGMDDFIIKPFDAPTLITTILRHVRISVLQAATPISALTQPQSPERVPWPAIAGIDLTDARVRLCDDFGLFLSNLRRLLNEFSDVSVPSDSEDSDAFTVYAARMHKLSGSAGMLGANAVQQLAIDARAACVAGETTRLERAAQALVIELERLGKSAEPVLRTAKCRVQEADKAPGAEDALTPKILAELIEALRQQSLSALYRFDAFSSQLRVLLGEKKFEIVRDQLDDLKFIEAAETLAESNNDPGTQTGDAPHRSAGGKLA
jgi:PAS domain S-box-containing protein